MVDVPETIWATKADGRYYACSWLVTGWLEYTRSDLVAELAAENERLKHDQTAYQSTIDYLRKRAEEAEALASTGAVKTLEWTRGWMNAEAQTEIGQYTITYRRDGSFEWGIGILKGWASSWDAAKAAAQADYERRILSALEPHPRATNTVDAHETANVSDKPEGQQEPVARGVVWFGYDENTGEFTGEYCSVKPHDARGFRPYSPFITRPSEQAVTEAMLRSAIIAYRDTPEYDHHIALRNALKAAMEAGG